MAALSLMVCLCLPEWRQDLSWKNILIELYTTNTNSIQNSSLWYLICLYMMFVLYSLACRIKYKKWGSILCIVIALLLLFIKAPLQWLSQNYLSLPDNRLPFKMDTALIALVFFLVALRFKTKIITLVSKPYSWIVLLILFLQFMLLED